MSRANGPDLVFLPLLLFLPTGNILLSTSYVSQACYVASAYHGADCGHWVWTWKEVTSSPCAGIKTLLEAETKATESVQQARRGESSSPSK